MTFLNLKYATNFKTMLTTSGLGYGDISGVSLNGSTYQISFLLAPSKERLLQATGQQSTAPYYYDGDSDPSNDPDPVRFFQPLSMSQDAVVRDILAPSAGVGFDVGFSDVASVTFVDAGNANHAAIVVGQNTVLSSLFSSTPSSAAITYQIEDDDNLNDEPELYVGRFGDIFLNQQSIGGWVNVQEKGSEDFYAVLHELVHSVGGMKHASDAADVPDTQLYTAMSYIPAGWLRNQQNEFVETNNSLYGSGSSPLFAYDLQLYDVQAIQSIYGANTSTRNELLDGDSNTTGTTYKLGQGLGRDGDANKAFMYTIWDGGGTTDTIDASGFVGYRARIDLRAGEFSSIGGNGKGEQGYHEVLGVVLRDIENVSIVPGLNGAETIENAIGGNVADDITGNALANAITGGYGNDIMRGLGGADTYHFAAFDGDDIIEDSGLENIISFSRMAFGKVAIERGDLPGPLYSDDLVIHYGTNGYNSSITARQHFDATNGKTVGKIQFLGETNTVIREVNLALIDTVDLGGAPIDMAQIFTIPAATSGIFFGSADESKSDYIYGDATNNSLSGRYGNDFLRGGAGNDTYNWVAGHGYDHIRDASGTNDVLRFGLGITEEMVSRSGDVVAVNLGEFGAFITAEGVETLSGMSYTGITYTGVFSNATTTNLSGTFVTYYDENNQPLYSAYEDQGDEIHGGIENDRIYGNRYNDKLYGGDGHDVIDGGGDADRLYGEGGNDILTGDGDDLILDGGEGADWLQNGKIMDGGADNDYISADVSYSITANGGLGSDKFLIEANSSTISGGDGQDSFHVFGNANTIYGNSASQGTDESDSYFVTGLGNQIIAGTGDDVIVSSNSGSINNNEANYIDSGEGDDVMYLSGLNRVKVGGNGGDIIYNKSGTVILEIDGVTSAAAVTLSIIPNTPDATLSFTGGSVRLAGYAYNPQNWLLQIDSSNIVPLEQQANFTHSTSESIVIYAQNLELAAITTFTGSDTIYAGSVGTTINAGAGQDVVHAGAGNDTVNGGQGIDDLRGDAGDDTLNGDTADDLLFGGAGQDTLNGGEGDDTLIEGSVLPGGTDVEQDTLNGDAGNDTITSNGITDTLNGGDGDDVINSQADGQILDGGAGNDLIDISGGTAEGIRQVRFSTGVDTISTTLLVDRKVVINFGSSFDESDVVLSYRPSAANPNMSQIVVSLNDLVNFNNSWIILPVHDATAHLWQIAFGGAASALPITSTQTTLTDIGDVVINANAFLLAADTVTTGAGADIIRTYGGADTVYAGAGADAVEGGAGGDTIYGEAGVDNLSGQDGLDTIHGGEGDDYIDGGADRDILNGNAGVDTILGGEGNDDLVGGMGNDVLYGDDQMSTGSGSDLIYGNEGDDEIRAGNGENTVWGGIGNDEINAGDGGDALYGEDGDDIINAGNGLNIVDGGVGNDQITGGNGIDTFLGGAGTDTLIAGAGNDLLHGGDDNDAIDGQDGNDTINGDAGDDALAGGSGDDTLDGGAGNDQIGGFAGNDILKALSGNDIVYGGTEVDELHIGTSIQLSDITFDRVASTLQGVTGLVDLQMKLTDGRTITVVNQYAATAGVLAERTETLQYGNGLSFNLATLFLARNDAFAAFTDRSLTGNVLSNNGNGADVGGLMAVTPATITTSNGATVTLSANGSFTYMSGSGYAGSDTFSYTVQNEFGASLTATAQIFTANDAANNITGTAAKDVINGYAGDDIINGGSGFDYLYGGDDADTINGEDGNDALRGAYGNDTIYGGIGLDSLTGDYGADTLYGGADRDNIKGGNDNDVLHGEAGDDLLFGDAGDDVLHGGDSDLVEDGSNQELWGGAGNDTIHGGSGYDYVHGNSGKDTVHAGGADDYVNGDSGDDVINGDAGHDTLYGGTGDDIINGGDGNDSIRGEEGEDILDGGAGNDDVRGGTDDNIVRGGDGNDVVYGGSSSTSDTFVGNDELYGDAGNDELYSGQGDDVLDGGTGDDILKGFEGSDTYVASAGADYIYDSAGTLDKLVFGATIDASDLIFTNGSRDQTDANDLVIGWNGGVDSVEIENQNSSSSSLHLERLLFADGYALTLSRYTSWTKGTSAGATHNGSAADNTILGFAGSDTLNGNDGHDELHGGDGTDTVNGGNGNDLLHGGRDNDIVSGGDGNDTLYGGAGDDSLAGGTGHDIYVVTAGTDTITESDGADVLTFAPTVSAEQLTFANTGTEDVTITVASGATAIVQNQRGTATGRLDTIAFSDGLSLNFGDYAQWLFALSTGGGLSGDNNNASGINTADTIIGGIGADTLRGYDLSDTLYGGAGNDIVYGGNDNDVVHGGSGDDLVKGDAGADTVYGGDGDDTLYGETFTTDTTGGNDVIYGGQGHDAIYGGVGLDTLYGEDGNDTIKGLADNDTIYGGKGNDNLDGGDGDDILLGDDGEDILTGGAGKDTANGGFGADTINGNDGDDTLDGGSGDDVINGGNGMDTVHGGNGNDVINGNSTTATSHDIDILYGEDGDDIIKGHNGDDFIYGGAGADILQGDLGIDTLDGGADGDTFMFLAASAFADIDVIKNFKATDTQGDAEDILDIHDLLIGYGTSSVITDFLMLTELDSNTLMSIDRDGTGTAHTWAQVARLEGVTALDENTLMTQGNLVA